MERRIAPVGTEPGVQLFSTAPPFNAATKEGDLSRVVDVAQWSEEAGCEGILVYSDNSLLDPWIVSQIISQNTRHLSPLVAIQPVYMHPYTVAKMVTSLGHLYQRRLFLNIVAGGFKNDLLALQDFVDHDRRYDRLIEYTTVVKELLANSQAVTFRGEFYRTEKLKLFPPLPPGLFPGIFVSGSSAAGLAAAQKLAATAVKYPKPAEEEGTVSDNGTEFGIRVGIIAREDGEDAWETARARFPEDRKGQLAHQLAMKVSDSVWHAQLSTMAEETSPSPYWLVPFQNYKTMCPYLVGSYGRVAGELAKYIGLGYTKFILDIPADRLELHHTRTAFQQALEEMQR